MHARAVFFICNGKQLLDEMNVALSSLILCCIVTKRWQGVNFRQYFCLSMSAWGSGAETVKSGECGYSIHTWVQLGGCFLTSAPPLGLYISKYYLQDMIVLLKTIIASADQLKQKSDINLIFIPQLGRQLMVSRSFSHSWNNLQL